MRFDWLEAKSFQDVVGCERCVYGDVERSFVLRVSHSAKFGSVEPALSEADEVLARAALLKGSRLFFTSLPPDQWERLKEMKEELRQDLQRHIDSLSKV